MIIPCNLGAAKARNVNKLLHDLNMRALWHASTEEQVCFLFWHRHLEWLKQHVEWEHADKIIPLNLYPDSNVQHRTIQRLMRFVSLTGLGNAHFGLTSSDVEDNARKSLLAVSVQRLIVGIQELIAKGHRETYGKESQTAFTHWQPAGSIKLWHRINAWYAPLVFLCDQFPHIHGKKLGGAVGDASAMKKLVDVMGYNRAELTDQVNFPWHVFALITPWNEYPIQSTDYIDETRVVHWIASIAARLHKIALDHRFMASHEQILIVQNPEYVGSSSIKEKSNPFIYEKVCSKCRHIMSFPHQMLEVSANNSMERTLDGSWQARHVMAEACILLDQVIRDFMSVEVMYVTTKEWDSSSRDDYTSDNIIDGKTTRMEVFAHENFVQNNLK